MTYPRSLCYLIVKVHPAIEPYHIKETWSFLRANWHEPPNETMVSLWVNRKDASHRYQHMHDAVADLLQLEDYVSAGTKMRIVREDEQPGMLTWPLNK